MPYIWSIGSSSCWSVAFEPLAAGCTTAIVHCPQAAVAPGSHSISVNCGGQRLGGALVDRPSDLQQHCHTRLGLLPCIAWFRMRSTRACVKYRDASCVFVPWSSVDVCRVGAKRAIGARPTACVATSRSQVPRAFSAVGPELRHFFTPDPVQDSACFGLQIPGASHGSNSRVVGATPGNGEEPPP